MDLLDIAFKAATVTIAIANLFFVIKFFNVKNKNEQTDKERDRKIQWLKTLILDHNLGDFYSFFEAVETSCNVLKQNALDVESKKHADEEIADEFILLRRKFTDTLIAIDDRLYKNVLQITDTLQTHITNTIFDIGVNLNHQPKFEELLLEKITIAKTDILKMLFAYRG